MATKSNKGTILPKTTKTEKELEKANLKLAAKLVELQENMDATTEGYIELSEQLREAQEQLAYTRETSDAWIYHSKTQEQQIAQLQSNLGAFRDRCKARVSELNMEARFWGIDIAELLKV